MKRLVYLAGTLVLAFAMLAVAVPAGAVDPGVKCHSALLKEVGKYANCRLKAESKAVKKGVAADYGKCEEKFLDKWSKNLGKGGDACPAFAYRFRETTDLFFAAAIADATDRVSESLDVASPGAGNLPYCKLPASGQTTPYESGDDGDVQAGSKLSFLHSGDQRHFNIPESEEAIVDQRTGLMWEPKNDAGGVRDVDKTYTWEPGAGPDDDVWDHVRLLNETCGGEGVTACTKANEDTDCAAASRRYCGFAGFTDWRVPNVKELQSIVNYEIPYPGPTVDTVFNDDPVGCASGCTTCSCTASSFYWSSTTGAAIRTTRGSCPSTTATSATTIRPTASTSVRFAAACDCRFDDSSDSII
jgi:hypothetical protein